MLILSLILGQLAFAIQLGGDRLEEMAPALSGKSIAMIAHNASRRSDGVHIIDWLHSDDRFKLTKIFTPEHGLRSTQDEWGSDSVDEATGLPVYSLYTPRRRAPTSELLEGVDVLIIDLKDVGMRYYTYATTMALAIEACAKNGVDVVILDRPNPLGGKHDGAVLASELTRHFISYFATSTRHGMTMGELALMFNQELAFGANVDVLEVKGWERSQTFDQLNLKWVAPSPALPKVENAFLYSITGPLETFNLSVGRGKTNTDAFKVFGAPWITRSQSKRLASRLNRLFRENGVNQLSFRPYTWRVTRSRYNGKWARGVRVSLTNYSALNTFYARALLVHGVKMELGAALKHNSLTRRFFGSEENVKLILDHKFKKSTLKRQTAASRAKFSRLRQKYLLY